MNPEKLSRAMQSLREALSELMLAERTPEILAQSAQLLQNHVGAFEREFEIYRKRYN